MNNSSNTPPTTGGSSRQQKKIKRNTRGVTMMTTLTKIPNTCVKLQVEFDIKTRRYYGENS